MPTPAIHVGGEIFLVICKDRHVDVMVSVHATRQSADGAIAAFMASYGEQWVERAYGRAQGWLRYVDTTSGEGPSAYIERGTLQGDG